MKKLFVLILFLFPLTLHAAKKPNITTVSLPEGKTTVVYTGGNVYGRWGVKPYTFTLVGGFGVLPTGLALSTVSSVGKITGTPSVAGTFSFKLRLTDSAGAPKTFDQTLYIVVKASAVPVVPALKIVTDALPGGVVSSLYETTIQAQDGTSPYSMAVTSGSLPAGLSLDATTGKISGTPTAPVTAGLTVTATDSGSIVETAKQNYFLSIINPTGPPPTYLFTDALSSLGSWDYVNIAGNPVIAACPGGGNCAQFRYVICGDNTNPACGASHQDINRWLSKVLVTGLTDPFFRGYVYFKSPEVGGTSYPIQRKTFWISDSTSAGNSIGTWSHGLTSDSTVSGIALRVFFNSSCGNTPTSYFPTGTLNYDTFYSIEMESKLNTPGSSDGEVRVWVDGVQVLNQSGVNQRGTCSTDAHFFSVGRQTDRNSYLPVDEYRYWKNVIINNAYIGP